MTKHKYNKFNDQILIMDSWTINAMFTNYI